MHETGTRLEILFKDADDQDVYFCFPYASPSATEQSVKNLITAILDNNTLFVHVPVRVVKAQTSTYSTHEYDLES